MRRAFFQSNTRLAKILSGSPAGMQPLANSLQLLHSRPGQVCLLAGQVTVTVKPGKP